MAKNTSKLELTDEEWDLIIYALKEGSTRNRNVGSELVADRMTNLQLEVERRVKKSRHLRSQWETDPDTGEPVRKRRLKVRG